MTLPASAQLKMSRLGPQPVQCRHLAVVEVCCDGSDVNTSLFCSYEREQEEAKADRERRAELEAELDTIHGRHAAEKDALEQELADRSAELETTQQALAKTQVCLATNVSALHHCLKGGANTAQRCEATGCGKAFLSWCASSRCASAMRESTVL